MSDIGGPGPIEPELQPFEEQLRAARPAPEPTFRGELGRAVAFDAARRGLRPRPTQLWPWVFGLAAISLGALLATLVLA